MRSFFSGSVESTPLCKLFQSSSNHKLSFARIISLMLKIDRRASSHGLLGGLSMQGPETPQRCNCFFLDFYEYGNLSTTH